MKVIATEISDLLIFEPKVFGDDRGCFFAALPRSGLMPPIPTVDVDQRAQRS